MRDADTLLYCTSFLISSPRFLNDKEISDGGNFSTGCKDSVYRLDISDVNEDLVGKIKVVAENENGRDEKEVRRARLTVS